MIMGGASYAALDLRSGLFDHKDDLTIDVFTQYIEKTVFVRLNIKYGLEIIIGGHEDLKKIASDYDLIHWFRTKSRKLFHSFHENSGTQERPPLILTHCQQPSSFDLRLSPTELSLSNKLVFISKAGVNHRYHRFINPESKEMIYFGTGSIVPDFQKIIRSQQEVRLIRGSSLNKCPKDMLNIFEKVGNDCVSFTIVGQGLQKSLKDEIKRLNLRKRVEVIGHLDRDDWMNHLKIADVYFYQLSSNSYSAIDATIQDAMLSKLPVVYYGPSAPAELIIDGVTGYVARTKSEFIMKTKLLIDNKDLRLRMGEASRLRILRSFNHSQTVTKYMDLYKRTAHLPIQASNHRLRSVPRLELIDYWFSGLINYLNWKKKALLFYTKQIVQRAMVYCN